MFIWKKENKCELNERFKSRSKSNKKTKEQLEILNKWLVLNIENPKPDRYTKRMLMLETGLTIKQINNWFTFKLKKLAHK